MTENLERLEFSSADGFCEASIFSKLRLHSKGGKGRFWGGGGPHSFHWHCRSTCCLELPFGQLPALGQTPWAEVGAGDSEEGQIRNSSFFTLAHSLWVKGTFLLLNVLELFKACDKGSLFAFISLYFSLTHLPLRIFIDLIYFILFSVDSHKVVLCLWTGREGESSMEPLSWT